jgi:hypothetical protein
LNTPLESQGKSAAQFGIPALRSLGDLSGMPPVLRADSREIQPLKFNHLQCIYGQTLTEADYQIAGISDWGIERKGSLDELAGCCMGTNRARQEREFKRLLPYSFKRLLIVGATCDEDILSYRYYSRISPRSVLGTLYGWQATFNLPFVLAGTPEKAALLIERWAKYWCAHKAKELNELLKGCRDSQVELSNPFS